MVLIQDLKAQIEQNNIPPFIIFICKGTGQILANHYIREIRQRLNCDIYQVESSLGLESVDAFGAGAQAIPLFVCDELKELPFNPKGYIICKSIGKNIDSTYICNIPEIEEWQLKDYLFSICEGAASSDLEYLFNLLKSNPERLLLEAERLSIFPPIEREHLLKEMLRENMFSDISTETIYTLSNALCVRDLNTVAKVLRELPSIDIEPVGLVTVMVNNFRNMLLIQGHPSPTPEKVGLPVKQFYAISHNLGHYTISQLMYILKELDDIDFKLKTGDLPVDYIIPYVITLILSVRG